MRVFWKYADQERFSRWISPYLMVLMLEGSDPNMGDIRLVRHDQLSRVEYLRLLARAQSVKFLFPDITKRVPVTLLLVLLVIVVCLCMGRKVNFELWRLAVPVAGLFFLALFISQLVTQPISVFRYFSFMVYLTVILAISLWAMVFQLLPMRKMLLYTSYVIPALLACVVTYQSIAALPRGERKVIRHFAGGCLSLADAFHTRNVRRDIPVALREVIGHTPRVYSFNINNYSMAPGCELETFVSFGLHQDWHEILFEPPEQARAALQKQGLNYFLIDLDMQVVDVLQYSPLFQPENINKFFQVRWHHGNAYLLTWPDSDTTPIPEEFLTLYNYLEYWCPFHLEPLYTQVRDIYAKHKDHPYPVVRDPSLPDVPGWQ